MSSARGLAQALELLVDHHRADAVVREHLHQQRAVDRERQDVRALDAAAAGLHAVLQVEGGVGRLGRRRAGRRAAARRRPARVRCRSALSGSSGVSRMPGTSVMKSSLSACSAMAVLVATSSIVRLKASPVGEKPNGDSSTSAPMSIARRIAARVDLAHHAAVHEVDAVDDADRPRGEEVARHHAHDRVGHRRVRQALRERGLDLEAQLAGGLLRAVERDRVGDAQAVAEARRVALDAQLLVDLRPEAVHQHQLDAHRVQDRQVLREAVELAGGDQLAGDRDDEGLAAVGVDVRRDGAEPRHEGVGEDEAHGRRGGAVRDFARSGRACRARSASPIIRASCRRPSLPAAPRRARQPGAAHHLPRIAAGLGAARRDRARHPASTRSSSSAARPARARPRSCRRSRWRSAAAWAPAARG